LLRDLKFPDLMQPCRGAENGLAAFGAPKGELGRIRAHVLAHVRRGAAERPDLFTLTGPTGGGKTLASLGFALEHARCTATRASSTQFRSRERGSKRPKTDRPFLGY
jgi:hypothetical protein